MFDFQILFQVGAKLNGFVAVHGKPFERFRIAHDVFHFGFDARKVVFADRPGDVKIVVKAVGRGRAERKAHAVKQPHHGPRHDVSGGMPEHSQRGRVAIGQQF